MNNQSTGLLTKDGVAIPLTGVEVSGDITGRATKIKVSQHFRNTEPRPLETIYKFPLPEGSSVCGFRAATNGKVIKGEIEEREKAFEIYDKALSKGDGGYLLDEERPNIFTLSLGNLNPGAEATIELDYVAVLDSNGSEVRFFLPTTISPRYLPPDTADINGIPAGELVNPPIALNVNYGLKISLNIHGRDNIQMLESPSHSISTAFGDKSIKVELTSEKAVMDRDFILNIKHKNDFETKGYYYRTGKECYIQVDFSPVAPNQSNPDNLSGQEIIFALDCSGSMGGSSIDEAKRALSILLKALEPGTFFNIYKFGSTFSSMFDSSLVYDSKHLETALKFLSGTNADLGGTEVLAPLQAIQRKITSERITSVILLTDGEVGNEEQILDLVRGSNNNMRLFTVGIGNGPNEYFIKQLARISGGAFELISPNERIEPKVLKLFKKVYPNSIVKGIQIDWGGEVIPTIIPPSAYCGETISLFAKTDDDREVLGKIVVSGMVSGLGREWTIIPTEVEGDNIPIPVLWARGKIQEYEEGATVYIGSLQYHRKDKMIAQAVIVLSKKYGIISRSTSFIAVEKRDETEKTTGESVLRKVPVMLTDGWGDLKSKSSNNGVPSLNLVSQSADLGAPSFMRYKTSLPGSKFRSAIPRNSYHGNTIPAPEKTDNILLRILSLQQADGGFRMDEDFAKVLNKPLTDLQKIAKNIQVKGKVDKFILLSTVLVIKYLEHEFKDDKDSWETVVKKSIKWLESTVANSKPTVGGLKLLDWADRFFEGENSYR